MSRGNVFKLSGNLALGGGPDTYSTNQLQSIKSSLRLLKARQSQKKTQLNADNNNNYGGPYTSNNAQRSQIRRNQTNKNTTSTMNKDYEYYQSSAKNHVPMNSGYNDPYEQPIKPALKKPIYQDQRTLPIRDKDTSFAPLQRNQYNNSSSNINARKQKESSQYDQPSARNQFKNRTYEQAKSFEEQPVGNNAKGSNYNSRSTQEQQYEDTRPKAQTRPPLRKQQKNQQVNDYDYNTPQTNSIQDKSIKQLNRQKKPEIIQYDPSSFVECSVGCGRKFNPDSISKHEAICYKVFQKKRKQFNTQEQRIIDGQHKKIVKNVVMQQKKQKVQDKNKNKNDQKMSKWKAQSLAFRSMLKNNTGEQMSVAQKKQLQEANNAGKIKCPHCGRTFNENAGVRHITFCQTQKNKNKFKK